MSPLEFGAGDFVALTSLVKTAVNACESGPEHNEELHQGLQSLQLALQPLEETFRSQTPIVAHGDSTTTRAQALGQILVNCRIAVDEVQSLINKDGSLPSNSRGSGDERTWDSYRIGTTTNLDGLRGRLALYESTIKVLIGTGIDVKIDRVYARLCRDNDTKVKLGSASLMLDDHGQALSVPASSSSSGPDDAWQLLRQELVKEGVAPDQLDGHRDEILAYVRSLAQTSESAPGSTSLGTYSSSQADTSGQTSAHGQPYTASQPNFYPQSSTDSQPAMSSQPQPHLPPPPPASTTRNQEATTQPYRNYASISEPMQHPPPWSSLPISTHPPSASAPQLTIFRSPPTSSPSPDPSSAGFGHVSFLYTKSNPIDLKTTKQGDRSFSCQAFYLHGVYNDKPSCFIGAEISVSSSDLQDLSSAEILMTIRSVSVGLSPVPSPGTNPNPTLTICETGPSETSASRYVSDELQYIGHMPLKLLPTKAAAAGQKLKREGGGVPGPDVAGTVGWIFVPYPLGTQASVAQTRVGVIVHHWEEKIGFQIEVRGAERRRRKKLLFGGGGGGAKASTVWDGGVIRPPLLSQSRDDGGVGRGWDKPQNQNVRAIRLTRDMLYGFAGHTALYGKDREGSCVH